LVEISPPERLVDDDPTIACNKKLRSRNTPVSHCLTKDADPIGKAAWRHADLFGSSIDEYGRRENGLTTDALRLLPTTPGNCNQDGRTDESADQVLAPYETDEPAVGSAGTPIAAQHLAAEPRPASIPRAPRPGEA
jgi:hypothetical protein